MKSDEFSGVAVITVEGELTGNEAAAVRKAVERRDPKDSGACVIDLERCPFLGSEGLETLLAALRACESRGANLKLAGLDENGRTVLQITRLAHRFECCRDVAAAVRMSA